MNATESPCHFTLAPPPPAIQGLDRFWERIVNAITTGSFSTEAEIEAWGAGLLEAKAQGPEAYVQYIRENPMYGATETILEIAATEGADFFAVAHRVSARSY